MKHIVDNNSEQSLPRPKIQANTTFSTKIVNFQKKNNIKKTPDLHTSKVWEVWRNSCVKSISVAGWSSRVKQAKFPRWLLKTVMSAVMLLRAVLHSLLLQNDSPLRKWANDYHVISWGLYFSITVSFINNNTFSHLVCSQRHGNMEISKENSSCSQWNVLRNVRKRFYYQSSLKQLLFFLSVCELRRAHSSCKEIKICTAASSCWTYTDICMHSSPAGTSGFPTPRHTFPALFVFTSPHQRYTLL